MEGRLRLITSATTEIHGVHRYGRVHVHRHARIGRAQRRRGCDRGRGRGETGYTAIGAIRTLGVVLRIPVPIHPCSLLPRRPARSHRHIRRPAYAPPSFRAHIASPRGRRPRFPLDTAHRQIPAPRAPQPDILIHALRDALEEIEELQRVFLVEQIEVRRAADDPGLREAAETCARVRPR